MKKRILKKKKNNNNEIKSLEITNSTEKNQYTFLALDNDEFYSLKLKNLIDSDAKNIAIMGDFATGKSTIIRSFITKHCNDYNTIQISSASFKGGDNDSSEEKSLRIQKEIIHQLHNILPEDNYINKDLYLKKKLETKNIEKLKWLAPVLVILTGLIKSNLEAIFFSNYMNEILQLILIILLAYVLFITVDNLVLVFKVKSVKVRNIEFVRSDEHIKKSEFITPETQLITNLIFEIYDEFNRGNIHNDEHGKGSLLVFIEDIDRHEDKKIFEILYQINNILNSSDARKIKFIYAIKPTMITESPTKYFDAILDVIPFFDKFTSAEKFKVLLAEQNIEISNKLLNRLSLYIRDYRDMLRIRNSIITYKEKFYMKSNYDKLVALITFKVLHPKYLNLKPAGVKQDEVEQFLELLREKANEENIEFQDAFKSDFLSEEKEKIKGIDKTLYSLLEYLIENNLVDDRFYWTLSPVSDDYSEIDRLFINNLNENGEILNNDISTRLTNVEKIIDNFVEISDYDKIALLNLDILSYVGNRGNDEIFNKMISNCFKKFSTLNFLKLEDNSISKPVSNGYKLNEQNILLVIDCLTNEYIENSKHISELETLFSIGNLLYATLNVDKEKIPKKDLLVKVIEVSINIWYDQEKNNRNYLNKIKLNDIISLINKYNVTLDLQEETVKILSEGDLYFKSDYIVNGYVYDYIYNTTGLQTDYLFTRYNKGEIQVAENYIDEFQMGIIEWAIKNNSIIDLNQFMLLKSTKPVDIKFVIDLETSNSEIVDYMLDNNLIDITLDNLKILLNNNLLKKLYLNNLINTIAMLINKNNHAENYFSLFEEILLLINDSEDELSAFVKELFAVGYSIDFDKVLNSEYLLNNMKDLFVLIKFTNTNINGMIDYDLEMFIEFLKVQYEPNTDFSISQYETIERILLDKNISSKIKSDVINRFRQEDKYINELSSNLELNYVNKMIQSELYEFHFDTLYLYKQQQNASFDEVKIIFDQLLKWHYRNDNSKPYYVSKQIIENTQEALEYVIIKIENNLSFQEFIKILEENKEILYDVIKLISETKFKEKFIRIINYINTENNVFINIPDELKSKENKAILNLICEQNDLKKTKNQIRKK